MEYVIVKYTASYEKIWDKFIEEYSINGTFLQQRRFLNYHGNKFRDASLLFYLDGKLEAVCPACEEIIEGEKVFYSHKGSTYGGFVITSAIYNIEKILQLLEGFEAYLRENEYKKCILKPTMKLLSEQNMELLDYAFYYNKYREYKELNLYIDYSQYSEEILDNLSHMKQRLVKRCIKSGMILQEIVTNEEIKKFYNILEKNLQKFNTRPVHTYEELLDLYYHRLTKEIKFYGAYLNGELLAGTMVFLFEKQGCVHTQYLAANPQYNKLSPMSFVYYSVAKLYKELGYKALSWGITTEHLGTEINIGLTNNKEAYGSRFVVNHIYEKEFEE